MADRSISIALEAKVQGFISGIKTAQQATTDFADRTAAFARDNEQNLDRVGRASMVMGAGLLAGVGVAVKSFMEFDSAMAEVQASTHETAGNMELLREAAVNAGADTAFSAAEAAGAIDELAKAGVSTKDILGGGLSGALSLAAAGSLEVGKAAEIAASALTQFGLKGEDIPHIADLLAAGAGKAQGSVEDMGMALNQVGLVAAQTGLSIEETTGGLAAFASAGLTGSDAGTSFKTMLAAVTPNSKEAAKAMEELGISAFDANGEFIGLSEYAGVLQGAMSGLTDEQRMVTMETIFGSDAVRAASVLYEQGAAGVEKWEAAVNDAGYAAVTASIKQDTLAGDIEKLGGSIDSVFIKSGSGAAEALRGLVQGAEDLVDAIGSIPAPVLNAGAGIAGIAGGALLLTGAVASGLPKYIEFRDSMEALAEKSPRAASGIGKVAKAAGAAAAAMVAMQVVGSIFNEKQIKSAEDYGQAILQVGKASSAVDSSALDSLFSRWDKFAGEGPDIRDLAGAVNEVVNPHIPAGIQDTFDFLFAWTGTAKNDLGQVRDAFRGLGDQMGSMVKNGAADIAAKSFQRLTAEFEKNGKGAKEALEQVPGYKDALLGLANQAGVTVEGQDLLDFALGKVPASMQGAAGATQTFTNAAGQAKPVTEELAKELEEVGISASGAVTDIAAFAASLFNAGLLSLSASGAAISYQAAIDAMSESIASNGRTLDLNTEAGRNNQSAFNSLAQAAMTAAEATATETLSTQGSKAAQDALQSSLSTSYKDLLRAAEAFYGAGEEANEMARKALGVPKNVNIDAWIADHASVTLDTLKVKADDLDGRRVAMTIETINRTINTSEYREDPSMAALDPALHADGGMVNYLASGGRPRLYDMRPRGTDTVPAMLTPGEIVMQKSSVDSIGAGNLLYANATGQLPPRSAPAAAPAAMGGFGAPAPMGDIYVQNPFTGEYMLAQMDRRAAGVLASADKQSSYSRTGRA
ncbi:phage tail tape measure protein [Pseudarthrobacter oxydans]|uniref:phage tail tape measure protein n=1 Tax=Pseudarthrobacter oxydans TaxID=1671 RepID=UPI003ECFF059